MDWQSKAEKAIQYLAETDEAAAKAKALMLGLDKQEKTIIGQELLKQDGTIPEKDAKARCSESYREWRERYSNAVADYEIYKNRRNTAAVIVEYFRSVNANRRAGQI